MKKNNHQGRTSLLKTPIEEAGKRFSFMFDATTPEEKSWAYRLLPSRFPNHLTEERLIQIIQASRPRPELKAIWTQIEGHVVARIQIFWDDEDGELRMQEAEPEQGPDVEPPRAAPQSPTPPPPITGPKSNEPEKSGGKNAERDDGLSPDIF